MKRSSPMAAALVAMVVISAVSAFEVRVAAVDKPDSTASGNRFYVNNREPLAPSVLVKLPLGAIKPQGWLFEFLTRQRDGLSGHLGEISVWLQKEDNAWLNKDGKGKWGWEEVPYWLKGYGDLAYLLEDKQMIAEARVWIEGALASQRPDGDFGPDHRFPSGKRDYWANMIMLFCLQSYYDYSGDGRVLELMSRYFAHQASVPEGAILSGYWDKMRGGDNLASIYWLYNRTGEKSLLDLARKIHGNTADWKMQGTLPNWHNVNVAQAFDEPAIYYQQSRDAADRQAAYDNFRIVRERFGQMPGGMFAADENARPGHDDPHQCVETCGLVEQMFSDEQLLPITGDLFWADHCEEVAFNSYPAALMSDFKALRYLTGANQVTSDAENHSPGVQNRGPMFLMNPLSHRCCQHNHSHGWPYYAEHLWFATPDNGLAAVLYCAGTVTAKVGNGTTVSVEERTHYPFDEIVEFVIRTLTAVEFPLYVRVPGWCEAPAIRVNGTPMTVRARPRQFVRLDNTWNDGDTVGLELPMALKVRRWTRNHDSASVDRGPLTYSLKIGETYRRRSSKEAALADSAWRADVDVERWPSWEIQPSTPWNYGLVFNPQDPASSFAVIKRPWPADNMPFTHEGTPIELSGTGKKIPQWTLDRHGLAGELQDSPVRSDEPAELITLIPMGAARLRISAFPVIGDGRDAKPWVMAP